jgi:hypothetical protein
MAVLLREGIGQPNFIDLDAERKSISQADKLGKMSLKRHRLL